MQLPMRGNDSSIACSPATSAANGWEQSEAAVSITLEIAWKSAGHLPVSFGWYVSGKVGYIGGVQGRGGDSYLGMTEGDI